MCHILYLFSFCQTNLVFERVLSKAKVTIFFTNSLIQMKRMRFTVLKGIYLIPRKDTEVCPLKMFPNCR